MRFKHYDRDMVYFKAENDVDISKNLVNKKNHFVVNVIVKITLILVGLQAMFLLVNDTFCYEGTEMDTPKALVVSAIMILIFAIIAYSGVRKEWFVLYVAVIAMLFFTFNSYIITGLAHMANRVIYRLEYYRDIDIETYFSVRDYLMPEALTVFAIFIGTIMGVILLVLSWRKVRVLPHIVPHALLIILSLNVGYSPEGASAVLYLIYIFALVVMHNSATGDDYVTRHLEIHSASGICIVIGTIIFMMFAINGFDALNYDETGMEDVGDSIEKFVVEGDWDALAGIFEGDTFNDIFDWKKKKSDKDDGKSEGDGDSITLQVQLSDSPVTIGNKSKQSYSGITHLSVNFSQNEPANYYLRSGIKYEYEDSVWYSMQEDYDMLLEFYDLEEFQQEMLNMPADSMIALYTEEDENMVLQMVTVDMVSVSSDHAVIPYFFIDNTLWEPYEYRVYNDGVYYSDSNVFQAFAYKNQQTLLQDIEKNRDKLQELQNEWRERYTELVYEAYTLIPENLSISESQFQQEFSSIKLQYEGQEYDLSTGERYYEEIGLQPYVDYVTRYLSNMTYTLEPGATAPEDDVVEDFLFTKKAGYCQHFATAAAMMFRQMGIPARYVDGYIVKKGDFSKGKVTENGIQIDVKDSNAHAWVEVYDKDFGWIPIEVTVGQGNSFVETENATTAPKETTKKQQATTRKKNDRKPTTTTTKPKQQTNKANDVKIPWKTIGIILAVLLTPVVIVYAIIRRRQMIIRKRMKLLNTIKLDKQIRKMLKIIEINITNDMSNEDISQHIADKLGERMYEKALKIFELLDKEKYADCSLNKKELKDFNKALRSVSKNIVGKANFIQIMTIKYVWCFA